MNSKCETAISWVNANAKRLSNDHQTIWSFNEPAWREYRASKWYVDRLREEGFDVDVSTAGMPTAFCAHWRSPHGDGPTIAAYAEYDAVPGNSQEAVPFRKPRSDCNEWAPGFPEPHSAVGIGALGGILAAKYAIERCGLSANLCFHGEPAENVCGGKVFHAAHGYYDKLNAAIAWRSAPLPILANTCALDTLCGCFWSKVYTFECIDPESWLADVPGGSANSRNNPPSSARPPGALDALCLMYTASKYIRDSMLPPLGGWSVNETILTNGSATADNLPPRFSQIQYGWRCATIEMAERVLAVLDANADHVAKITHTRWRSHWVSRTRPGLPNHELARIAYDNFKEIGAPRWSDDAKAFARECQKSLGLEPMAQPFLDGIERMLDPEEAEAGLRKMIPAWQSHYGADDYVEYTWHAPTVRILVARPRLQPPHPSYRYPQWVSVASGGVAAIVDPVMLTAARVIGSTIVDLITDEEKLSRCKAEFERRTGGGIGGTQWIGPLLERHSVPPVSLGWPEYVSTPRGFDWYVPDGA